MKTHSRSSAGEGTMAGETQASSDPAPLFDAMFAMQRQMWQAWSDLADPNPDGDRSGRHEANEARSPFAASMADALRQQAAYQAAWTRWWLASLPVGDKGAATDMPDRSEFERLSVQWLDLNRRLAEAWLDALTAHPAASWSAPFALTRGMLDGWQAIQREWQDQGTWNRLLHVGELRRQVPDEEPPPEVEELEDMAKAAAVDARRQRRSGTHG
jgi:hypothetical protein